MITPGSRMSRWITIGALSGLLAGLAAGVAVHGAHDAGMVRFADGLSVLGTLWMNALRAIVLPLVVSNLIVAIALMQDARAVGRLGGAAVALFVAMLAGAALFAGLVVPPVLARFAPDATVRAALHEAAHGIAAVPPTGAASTSFADWLGSLVPDNIVRTAAAGDLLPIVLFTVVFALALNRIAPEPRRTLLDLFRAAYAATLVMMRWALAFSPIGVFALGFALAAHTGAGSVGAFGYWIVLVSALMLACTLVLYPVTALFARVPIGRFAYAALPAQSVAAGTRSSIASLPALIEGAQQRLGLPPAVAGFALPLAVSTFKLNRTPSSVAKLLFLAALYGVPLDPAHVIAFVAMVGLLSFSTPGIPSAGTLASIPAYLAAGIPLEGVILLNAVDAIPDIFKTMLNVTGNLSVAAILTRIAGPGARPTEG